MWNMLKALCDPEAYLNGCVSAISVGTCMILNIVIMNQCSSILRTYLFKLQRFCWKYVKVLYVRNLAPVTTEDQLLLLFSMGGALRVERVKKMRDFAFVHYNKREDAENALGKFDVSGHQFTLCSTSNKVSYFSCIQFWGIKYTGNTKNLSFYVQLHWGPQNLILVKFKEITLKIL
ncbi:UNVERIFIED_CONTAM: Rbm46 [Trichonephila clavipes]